MDDDHLGLEPMNKGRNTPIVVGVIVVLVASVIAYFAQSRLHGSREADSLERTATAWNELRRCLVGDALHDRERASRVVRRIELGLPRLIEDVAPDDRPTAWPFRCATHASVMTHALFDTHSDDANLRLLEALVSRASTSLDQGELRTGAHDRLTWIDELFEMMRRVTLPAGAPAHGPLPPHPATILSPHQMTPILAAQGADAFVASDPDPARAMRLVVGRTERTLCTFPAAVDARLLAVTHCRPLPFATAPLALSLLASDDDAPTFALVNDALYDADARTSVTLPAHVAPIAGDTSVAHGPLLRRVVSSGAANDAWTLETIDPAAAVTRTPVTLVDVPRAPSFSIAPRVVGGVVVALVADPVALPTPSDAGVADASVVVVADASANHADGAVAPSPDRTARLFAAEIPATPTPPLALALVGATNAIAPSARVLSCRTDHALALVVDGGNGHVSVAFDTAGHWSAPVSGDAPSNARISCRASEACLTWIENTPHRWLHQLRCTSERCSEAHGSFPTFAGDAQPVAVDVDGNVALLVSPGPGHGLELVFAPLADIGRADRHVILDDANHDGLDLAPIPQLYSRATAAVAIVSTSGEPFTTYAIHIDARGEFAPVRHDGTE